MKRTPLAAVAAFVMLLALACTHAAGAGERIRIGPVPDWVVRVPEGMRKLSEEEHDQPLVMILNDIQVADIKGTRQEYMRQIFALNSLTAVENYGTLNLVFDPTRQKAFLHRIAIHRQGQVIDVTKRATLHTQHVASSLNPQRRADQAIITYVVPNLKPGDILDMEVSLVGDLAGLNNHLVVEITEKFDRFLVHELHRRIVASPPRPLRLELVAGHPPPVDRSSAHRLVWEWKITNYKQPHIYPDAPAWFSQIPAIRVSDFRDWAEVVVWGLKTLRPGRRLSRRTRKLARRIVSRDANSWEKLKAVLTYVQNNIRYLGNGLLTRNGYMPLAPEKVAAQGVGDCKDKVALAIALLKAVGIEAWPVLTNLSKGRVPRAIPTPLAFDHALLAVRLDGHDVWVDPTRRPLPDGRPDFRLAHTDAGLIIRPGETELRKPSGLAVMADGTLVAAEGTQQPTSKMHIVFQSEIDRVVDLITNTVTLNARFSGDAADVIRANAELAPKDQLQKFFRILMESWAWNIKPEGEIEMGDDPHMNSFHLRMHGKLPEKVWQSDGEQEYFLLEPLNIFQIIASVQPDEERPESVPLALKAAREGVRERFIIKVPSSWFLQPIHRLLERDAYKLSEDADWAGGQFVVSYVFQPRHDYLTPAQARQLYKDYKTLRRKSFYRLWRSTSAEQSGRVP